MNLLPAITSASAGLASTAVAYMPGTPLQKGTFVFGVTGLSMSVKHLISPGPNDTMAKSLIQACAYGAITAVAVKQIFLQTPEKAIIPDECCPKEYILFCCLGYVENDILHYEKCQSRESAIDQDGCELKRVL